MNNSPSEKPKEKLLLLHGWDWKNYPQFNKPDSWSNRSAFVTELRKNVQIETPSLPGFGNSTIPDRPWDLEDYADWLEHILRTNDYSGILGYSFGGAVLTRWAKKYLINQDLAKNYKQPQLFFVSPAIVRRYARANSLFSRWNRSVRKTFPLAARLFQHLYLCYWINNEYYRYGGTFQRNTYFNIVRLNLSDELALILKNGIKPCIIFGANDTATPPSLLYEAAPAAIKYISIIDNGGHDIANSHTKELVRIIFQRLINFK